MFKIEHFDFDQPRWIAQKTDFVVVDKPPGWLTVPDRQGHHGTRPILGRWIEKQLSQVVYPIHRLDFEASGLVAFAIKEDSQRQWTDRFEKREIQKTYLAWSTHVTMAGSKHYPEDRQVLFEKGKKGIWESRILRGKRRSYLDPRGQDAVTHFEMVNQMDDLFNFVLNPKTGRPHQIRFELASRGYPILGDEKYGGRPWPGGRPVIALRSIRLGDFLLES